MAAIDRYSSMNLGSPWRGLNVVPAASVTQGERQAVMFLYSGILAAAPATPAVAGASYRMSQTSLGTFDTKQTTLTTFSPSSQDGPLEFTRTSS